MLVVVRSFGGVFGDWPHAAGHTNVVKQKRPKPAMRILRGLFLAACECMDTVPRVTLAPGPPAATPESRAKAFVLNSLGLPILLKTGAIVSG
jgi:hypothetical protein